MEKGIGTTGELSPEIRQVADALLRLLRPLHIILYNQRTTAKGETSGFKLCVVAPVEDKLRAEQTAYLEIDCDVPFDLLLYTPEEWEEITAREDSFGSKILRTGIRLND